jgi:hypothetical protein
MPKDETPNPIYDRLTRYARGPSKALLRWLSIGIGLAALLAATVVLTAVPTLITPVMLLAGTIVGISPAVLAVYAANLTAADLREENLQVLKLAGITENAMLYGYANAAFHRMRLWAAIAAALTPTLVMAGALAIAVPFAISASSDLHPLEVGGLLVSLSPIMALLTFAIWFLQKIGGTLGALLAVWWKRPLPAMIAASLAMLIIMPVVLYSTLSILACPTMMIVAFLVNML